MHAIADPSSDAVNVLVFDSGYEPGLDTLDTYWWEKICSWTHADPIEAPRTVQRNPEAARVTVSFAAEDLEEIALLEAGENLAPDPELNQYWAFAYIGNIATRQAPQP